MKYFDLIKNFVDQEFTRAQRAHHELNHFDRAVYWLKILKPDADEACLSAAYSHDIERAFRGETEKSLEGKNFQEEYYTKQHPKKGAEIIAEFLAENNAPLDFINKVSVLIANHETGGTDEQNLIKDADSISFLEDKGKIDRFIERTALQGKEAIKNKFDWMFDCITAPKAKEIARPF
ncbi:MAG: HD domain-containing protein [Candidatus Doudnabacteria bacterium]|nr:HD domain-containing protein [Candidatus Doudnabacteria bacterium]